MRSWRRGYDGEPSPEEVLRELRRQVEELAARLADDWPGGGFDRRAYMRDYMRRKRQRAKEGR
jgi:hypothetical protein